MAATSGSAQLGPPGTAIDDWSQPDEWASADEGTNRDVWAETDTDETETKMIYHDFSVK